MEIALAAAQQQEHSFSLTCGRRQRLGVPTQPALSLLVADDQHLQLSLGAVVLL